MNDFSHIYPASLSLRKISSLRKYDELMLNSKILLRFILVYLICEKK